MMLKSTAAGRPRSFEARSPSSRNINMIRQLAELFPNMAAKAVLCVLAMCGTTVYFDDAIEMLAMGFGENLAIDGMGTRIRGAGCAKSTTASPLSFASTSRSAIRRHVLDAGTPVNQRAVRDAQIFAISGKGQLICGWTRSRSSMPASPREAREEERAASPDRADGRRAPVRKFGACASSAHGRRVSA
jgi:hypothetical protein